ncbi:zona pellucida sperm-binding protein 3-like [Pholidichthys leucotaenia]
MIRDQLAEHVHSEAVWSRLLAFPGELTLTTAVELAQWFETAEIIAKGLPEEALRSKADSHAKAPCWDPTDSDAGGDTYATVVKIKGKHEIYRNELVFRPKPRPNPAVFVYKFACPFKRPDDWVPSKLGPAAGISVGHSGLIFHMALLNEKLTGIAKTNVFTLGSFMPIWAAVEQKFHQPLLLLMDECVAARTAELRPEDQVHPIITDKGCLRDKKSMFLPRYHPSALILKLQSFAFGLGQEIV